MSSPPADHRVWALLATAPLAVAGCAADPASLWNARSETRNLTCIRLPRAQAHELAPGTVPDSSPRAETFEDTDALVCSRGIMEKNERAPRDEVVLSSLRQTVQEITQAATALHGDDVTWHVDAFYPEPTVASKISVAARVDLAERRRRVSDRAPALAPGDITVLRRLKPREAYPLACARYFAENVLGEKDLLLGLMLVDTRETQLHAGLCAQGQWRWLR